MAQGQHVDPEDRSKFVSSIRTYIRTNPGVARVLAQELLGHEILHESFRSLLAQNANSSLIEIWGTFYSHLLPNLQSVLYPYEVR